MDINKPYCGQISQYIQLLHHYAIHLELYVNYISLKKKTALDLDTLL